MNKLDDKAKMIQDQHDAWGLYEGMAYGHSKDSSGRRDAVMSVSDGCFHTGQALASEALRMRVTGEGLNKIQQMVKALFRMQFELGDGQLARYYAHQWTPGLPEPKNTMEILSWQEMTWDQYIPIFYGMYHLYLIRDKLDPDTKAMIKNFLQIMGDHFIKNKGFVGPDYKLKVHPWYLFIKRHQIIYGQCIMHVCSLWTDDYKFGAQYREWQDRFLGSIYFMGQKSKPLAERWYVRFWMKTAYFFRNWKTVPEDVLISQEHLNSRIGPHLRFMALVPLLNRDVLYSEIFEQEYRKIESRHHPWFMANYYGHQGVMSVEEQHDFLGDMEDYRGPKIYNNGYDAIFKRYLNYTGEIIERSETALSAKYYKQHWAWPQSLVYTPGSFYGPEMNVYDDHVGWLTPYYIMKLNRWDESQKNT